MTKSGITLYLLNNHNLISITYMSQKKSSVPSFLLKLQDIMSSDLYTHIIRWDKSGQVLCIVCVQALEEAVLPHYFRHARYSSFVRQLNMYGFGKRKADKNVAAAFQHKHFSKANVNFAAMSKRGKKQSLQETGKDSAGLLGGSGQEIGVQHQISTQLSQNSLKMSAYNRQADDRKDPSAADRTGPEMCELIAELSERVEPLLQEIEWLGWRELELLMREPKYEKISCAVLGIMNMEQLGPFGQLPLSPLSSDRMEFIL